MRTVKVLLPLLVVVALAAAVEAQMTTGRVVQPAGTDFVQIEEDLAVLRGTLGHLRSDLSSLQNALGQQSNLLWMAADGSGWSAASRDELIQKIHYVRLAGERAERKNQTNVAGLGLPSSLVELVHARPNRPAGRILREWTEGNAADTEKAVAAYRQSLTRNIRSVESWIAENDKQRRDAMAPVSQGVLSQGGCYIPTGRWAVDSSQEVLEVRAVGQTLLATKTRGNANIPAGKVSFYVNSGTCFGGMQMSDPGFANPYWMRGRIEVSWLSDNQFRIVWPERGAVVYNRAR